MSLRILKAEQASWQSVLRESFTNAHTLLAHLGFAPDHPLVQNALESTGGFPLRVPRPFAARMRRGDPSDPVLLQVLARQEELLPGGAGFALDPVGDEAARKAPGVLSKYRGRALLVVTGACAIHCRYCFRRHYPYQADAGLSSGASQGIAWIADNPDIREVILSGGDPLLLPDATLADLLARLEAIPHLTRIRWHTRTPVVIPERVTEGWLDLLHGGRLRHWVVLHINHPQELDPPTLRALGAIADAGAALLNQAVLLKGINDEVETQVALSEILLDHRIAPYYLHLLDRVAGAAHFEVAEEQAQALLEAMRSQLPGYGVPRLVREVTGAPFKVPVETVSSGSTPHNR